VVTKNSSGTTTESISYTYDTDNRRISQTATGASNVSEQYVYDGSNLLAVINPSTGQMVEDYFNGLNADGQTQAFAEETLSSNASTGVNWMLTDNVGSVKDVVTNASGHTVLDHIVYDSYGDILSQTNSANDTRIGYAGYVQDKATSRDYDNARYYQPYTGRFISQDPSGFAGGDTNLYRYVGNAPTTATDPTGLYAVLGSGSLGQFNSSYGWEPSSSIADNNYYSTTKSILDVNSGAITGGTASPVSLGGGLLGGNGYTGGSTLSSPQAGGSIMDLLSDQILSVPIPTSHDSVVSSLIQQTYADKSLEDSQSNQQAAAAQWYNEAAQALPVEPSDAEVTAVRYQNATQTVQTLGALKQQLDDQWTINHPYLSAFSPVQTGSLIPSLTSAQQDQLDRAKLTMQDIEHPTTFGDVILAGGQVVVAFGSGGEVAESTEAADNVGAAEYAQAELQRPYIRNATRQAVEDAALRTPDGRPIDPNTLQPIDGTPDLGHKPGNEFWREKAQAEAEGLTQKQFNDRMNDPSKYQLEDPSSNRSHKYEQP
jgi:RHS repeat-associated protein